MGKKHRARTAALTLVAMGVLLAAGRWFFKSSSSSMRELHRIEDLQHEFNEDRGVPRLVLLLSPT